MLCERVYLYEGRKDVYFDTYCAENYLQMPVDKRPAVLVIPGGGYSKCCCEREGEPVARVFFAAGYNVFVLNYSTSPNCEGVNNEAGYPKPLLEASVAMSKIKQNAKRYHIDPQKVAVIGFSAGGHLAASLGTLWYKDFIYEQTGIEYGSNKPCAMILSYPVITMEESFTHAGTAKNILMGSVFENAAELFSIEKQVSEKTVPAFIWHTAQDNAVPVKNSLELSLALSQNGIPFELHVYPYGNHGLATCDEQTCVPSEHFPHHEHVSSWKKLVLSWLEEIIMK